MKKVEIVEILEKKEIETPEGATVKDLEAIAKEKGIDLKSQPEDMIIMTRCGDDMKIPKDRYDEFVAARWKRKE